ncbi:hypothetical protein ACF0H5_016898 [Mactra antiquata]
MIKADFGSFLSTVTMKSPVHDSVLSLGMQTDRAKSKEKEGIHSGHFMVSRVHDNKTGDYLSDEEDELQTGFNFSEASKDTCTTYKFGPRSTQTLTLDASLSTLFDKLTLAYSGKLTSPKWKQFRGMHMHVKEKIRVNNIIWREWHMQYIFGKQHKVCQFATPLQDAGHSRPEAVVLEGYYWKRRLDTIAKEYKMWRKFFRQKRFKQDEDFFSGSAMDESSHSELLERVSSVQNISSIPKHQQTSNTDLLINTRDIQEMMELSDSLFSTLKHPFDFPNPKELSGFGYGDYIQPGLLQFQPSQAAGHSLEDFMELDPIHDLWPGPRATSSTHSGSVETPQPETSLRVPSMDVDMASSSNMIPSPQLILSPQTPPTPSSYLFDSPVATPSPGTSGDNSQMLAESENFILNQLQMLQQQKQHEQQQKKQHLQQQQLLQEHKRLQRQQEQQQQQQRQRKQQEDQLKQLLQNEDVQKLLLGSQNASSILELIGKSLGQQSSMSTEIQTQTSETKTPVTSNSLLLGIISSPTSPSGMEGITSNNSPKPKTVSSNRNRSILEALNADESARDKSLKSKTVNVAQNAKRTCSNTPNLSQQFGVKKDTMGFTIPAAPLKTLRSKQRPLAPTPPPPTTTQSSISQQNSYLAQLLTTGTYPGAIINVKDESQGNVLSQLQQSNRVQNISPSQPASSSPITIADFPTSVLIAAASHALSPSHISVKEVFQTVSKQVTSNSNSMVVSPIKHDTCSSSMTYNSPGTSSPVSVNSSSTSLSFDDSFLSVKSPDIDYHVDIKDDDPTAIHLSAEKKRRNNIKSGFDLLHTLIPSLRQNPNAKVSKAAMLQKTAEYCKKLKSERAQMQNEADILKQEINSLNQAISICQSQLPATGVPVTRQRADQMREMFEEYVKQRTLTNWKFWIFSLVIRNLFESYNTMVSTASVDELCRTVLAWLDQHCSLPSLRPIVSDAMRHLSTTTSILSDPARVPEQAAQAVIKRQKHQSGDGAT